MLGTSPQEVPALPTRDVQAVLRELQKLLAELASENEELRCSKQELIETRNRYMDRYHSIPVGCLTLDASGVIRDANAAAQALLNGCSNVTLTGQPLDAFVAQEDADTCRQHLRLAEASGLLQRKDVRFRRPDGTLFWADLETLPVQQSGSPETFRLTLRDIHERKQTEERLRRSAAEIQSANATLTDSRRAALNVMEDAIEARREAEQANAALLASEQRIQQALLVGHSFTFEWQPDTDHVERSASCGPILGLTGNDACVDTGQHYFQRVHPDDRARFVRLLGDLAPDNDTYTTEYRVTREDGSVITLEETGQAVFDTRGQMRLLFGVTSNITARRQAEAQMRFQARLLEAVGQPVVSTDLEQRITYWNHAAAALFGWTAEEVLGRNLAEVTRPDPLPEGTPDPVGTLSRGESWSRELLLHRKDGRPLPLLATNAPVFDEQGKPVAVIAVGVDLTERKLTEDVFRFLSRCEPGNSEEHFFQELARYLAVALAMDFVCIDRLEAGLLTAKTLGVYNNGALEENISYTLKDTPCGKVVDQGICCYPQNVQALFPDDKVLSDLRAESYIGTLLRSALGEPIGLIALISSRPLSDPRLPMSILQVVAVRTASELERQQAERHIKHLNADLERRVEERTAELAAANRELESFCYSVSHDLRAPLRNMDGFSQALLEDYGLALGGEAQDFLHRIRSSCQRMARLIDDLLRLSRLTRAQMRHLPVDLTALARAALSDLRQAEPTRRVEARISEGLTTYGDPSLLGTALANLLENAWKFTGQRPDAVIEVGQTDHLPPDAAPTAASPLLHGAALFFVRDNGVGFDMRYADKLFTPFQRLHAEKDFPGSGIGLATVQRVLNRHGGHIWFRSGLGQGTTFYFTTGASR